MVGSTERTCESGFEKYKALHSTLEPVLGKKGNLHGDSGLDVGLILDVYAVLSVGPRLYFTAALGCIFDYI